MFPLHEGSGTVRKDADTKEPDKEPFACLWASPISPHKHCNEFFDSPSSLFDHILEKHNDHHPTIDHGAGQCHMCLWRQIGASEPCWHVKGGWHGYEDMATQDFRKHVREHIDQMMAPGEGQEDAGDREWST